MLVVGAWRKRGHVSNFVFTLNFILFKEFGWPSPLIWWWDHHSALYFIFSHYLRTVFLRKWWMEATVTQRGTGRINEDQICCILTFATFPAPGALSSVGCDFSSSRSSFLFLHFLTLVSPCLLLFFSIEIKFRLHWVLKAHTSPWR